MARFLVLIILISATGCKSIASTSELSAIKELLIGKWIFLKAIDNSGNEVNFVPKEGRFGWEMNTISGPNIEFNSNNECIKYYGENSSLFCSWQLTKNYKIKYGNQYQKLLNKKIFDS